MNRLALADAIHAQTGMARGDVLLFLASLVHQVEAAVARGEKVAISGFGSFEPQQRAARTFRNPRTGEPVEVPATIVPAFRAGQQFRDVVNGRAEPPKVTLPRRPLQRPPLPPLRGIGGRGRTKG